MSEIGKVDVFAWALMLVLAVGLCFATGRRSKGWYLAAAALPFIVLPLLVVLAFLALIGRGKDNDQGPGEPPRLSGPSGP